MSNETNLDDDCFKFKNTNLLLNGKFVDEFGTIRYYKDGKLHNENGPAYIRKDGYKAYWINRKRHRIDGPAIIYVGEDYDWWINGWYVEKETINNWLTENDIPLDWNTWTNEDKMLFALHWYDYKGQY